MEKVLDKEWLVEQYVRKNRTVKEIAKEIDSDRSWLAKKMKLMGIDVKSNNIKIDMIGKKYGKLTCISESLKRTKKKFSIYYNFVCECGETTISEGYWVRKGRITRCNNCTISGKEHAQWSGYEEISGNWWGRRKRRAESSNLKFEILPEYAWELFVKQNRKCIFSGLELTISLSKEIGTASLDRIDSSKGYVEGNIQWVHKDINFMKQKYSSDYFIKICKLVASNC
jgi:hypothetical protein